MNTTDKIQTGVDTRMSKKANVNLRESSQTLSPFLSDMPVLTSALRALSLVAPEFMMV